MTRLFLIGAAMALLAACSSEGGDDDAPPAGAESDLAARRESDLAVMGWNLEYFGSRTAGPRDDALQVANAATVIDRMRPDVLGLVEITDAGRFAELKAKLPGYDLVSADDARVVGGAAAYGPTSMRPAFAARNDRVSIRSAKVVPDIDPGRPLLEVAVSAKYGGRVFEFVVVVLHFYPFAEPASWYRRRDSAERLKHWLDINHPNDAVAVIGDFNDDVDDSIIEGWRTPYDQLRDDAAHYRFTTQGLSVAKQGTTVDWPATIDHHLVTNELAARYVPYSAWVERPPYIADYRATTSDHYPVMTRYTLAW